MKNMRCILLMILLIILTVNNYAQIAEKPVVLKESDIINMDSYSGTITEDYLDGHPRVRKMIKNGLAHGLWTEWHPNGNIRYRAYWKDGLGHGRWEYFYPNGVLRMENFYVNDINQGIAKSYFDNGKLQSDVTYLNGRKHGVELIYDANGLLIKQNFYEDGRHIINEPTLFEPDKISSKTNNEWGITFSPDFETAYFTRRDSNTGKKRIYESKKIDNEWSEPVIASFSTDEDETPFINKTGTKIFFSSYRPLPNGTTINNADSNIWYVDKTAEGWSEAKPINGQVNKSQSNLESWPVAYEAGAITDEKGNLFYWSSSSQKKNTNLYFAKINLDGTYTDLVELLEPSSHAHYDSAPALFIDGEILFFVSDNRNDGLAGSDIYYSKKQTEGWSTPKNLMPNFINTYFDDGFPSFSPDGKYFFFSSTRAGNKDGNGMLIWDLYFIESKYLILE